MADEPISSLNLYTTYHTADEIEILDTVDQTFAPTGTNKRIQVSTLLSMAGVGTVAEGGTGLTSVGSNDQLLGVQHSGGGLEYKTLTAGTNINITPGAGEITISASGGGSGTVSSVAMTVPSWLSVAGSPITGSGTLAITAASCQSANQVLATSGGALTVRALVAADIPSLPASQITSGQLGVAQGGTGLATLTTHSVLLGEGTSNLGAAITGTAGQLLLDQGSGNDPAFKPVSGDGSLTATGALTVTKTSGTAFAPSATTDTTNASNISSGTLAINRVALPGSSGQLIYNNGGTWGGAADLTIGSSGQLNYASITDPGSPNAGDLWQSSTAGVLSFLDCGVRTRAGGVIWQATAPLTAVANTASLTTLLAGGTQLGTLTIPANSLAVGKVLEFGLYGTYGTTASSPTLTIEVLFGGNIVAQGTSAVLGSSVTGCAFYMNNTRGCGFMVQATGSSGKIIGLAECILPSGTCTSLGGAYYMTASGAGAAPSQVTINTTGPLAFDVRVQWSSASPSNTIQVLGGFFRISG